jgi:hypothetical protein
MKTYYKIYLGIILQIITFNAVDAQWVTNHDPLFQPNITQPAASGSYTDPKFGTTITRLTDARTSHLAGIVPNYSKRQAWNSDESLMLLSDYGNGNVRLYNGNTYQFISNLYDVAGEDIFWSPNDPDLIYFNRDSVLNSYRISTSTITELHAFTQYSFANTRGEGNMSNDGRYYAVAGQHYIYSSGEVVISDILVYDLQSNSVISTMALPYPLDGFDWVSISPLGNYVVVDYANEDSSRYHGIEVYDRNLNFIWQKPVGAGHSDLGIDAGGQEVLVMDKYNALVDSTYIMKYRLSDGQETILLGLSPLFDMHESCRNQQRRDWCFISTFDFTGRLTDDSLSWMPFEDEVFGLKLDGSKNVQRIAHHHSRRYSPTTPDPDQSVYAAEPHATINRTGDRILFGSNWRLNVEQDSSVDTYLVDFSNFLGLNDNYPTNEIKCNIFPNPAGSNTNIQFTLNSQSNIRITITDITGKLVKELLNTKLTEGTYNIPFDTSSFPEGLYFSHIFTDQNIFTFKLEVVK